MNHVPTSFMVSCNQNTALEKSKKTKKKNQRHKLLHCTTRTLQTLASELVYLFVTWVLLVFVRPTFDPSAPPPLSPPSETIFGAFAQSTKHLFLHCTKGRRRDLTRSKKRPQDAILARRPPLGAKKDQRFDLLFILDLFWMLFFLYFEPSFQFLGVYFSVCFFYFLI